MPLVRNGHGISSDGRRAWISNWEYKKQFGDFPNYETPDLRTDMTVCKWCGGKLSKRQSSFCSPECSRQYGMVVTWQRSIPKVPWCVIIRDRFACTKCGLSGLHKNQHGILIPCNIGLEVDHIIPISKGGTDHMDNLRTLCTDCHKARHQEKGATK